MAARGLPSQKSFRAGRSSHRPELQEARAKARDLTQRRWDPQRGRGEGGGLPGKFVARFFWALCRRLFRIFGGLPGIARKR